MDGNFIQADATVLGYNVLDTMFVSDGHNVNAC